MEEGRVSSVSTLPWSWVIETLARSQQVGVVHLCELVSKAPPLTGDSGKKAREAFALRCLEGFVGPTSGFTRDDHVDCRASRVGFDSGDSCEDVLQRVLLEGPGSDMQKDDELKRGVCSFIERKKASLPGSSLELLKNIVEGTHPLAASFKEISGLAREHQCVSSIASGAGDPMSPPSAVDANDHGSEFTLPEEHNDSPRQELHNKPLQANSPNQQSKRDTSHVCDNDHVQETDDTEHDMENHEPPGKKLKLDKQCDEKPEQQHSSFPGGVKMSNVVELEPNHPFPEANGTLEGKSCGESFGDTMKIDVEPSNQPQISPNKDEQLLGNTVLQEKLTFLSSQSTFIEDSLSMPDTEASLCVKCNKGGELLDCSASSCPLAFHESCLGCSASFDDQGNFYCPFCAYSRAISEYLSAKKKATMARNELSLFIGGASTPSSPQPRHDSTKALGDNINRQGEKEDTKKDKLAEPKKGVNVAAQHDNLGELRSSKDKEQKLSAPPAPASGKTSAAAAPENTSSEDRQGAETIIELGKDATEVKNQSKDDDHRSDHCKLSHENERVTSARQEGADSERKGETKGHPDAELQREASESIYDADGHSEDEKSRATSSVPSCRPLRAIPVSRRKRVRWTAEEEDMLKKGVDAFVKGDNVAIPWKHILEYGGSVFQKGRTAMDLKDKWKNMMRGR